MLSNLFSPQIDARLRHRGVIILSLFLVIQPILDLNVFFLEDFLSIGGVTFPTIIRYVFVVLFMFLTLVNIANKNITFRDSKKAFNAVILLISIFILYFSVHVYVINSYNENIQKLYPYSIAMEISYFIRISVPLILLYFFYIFDIRIYFKRIILGWFILVPFSIVVLNVTKMSLSSYNNKLVLYNFFDWFDPNLSLSYVEIATKGAFRYANQISMVLCMLLPFQVYYYLKNKTLFSYISLIFTGLAMTSIGTKVSFFSFPLILVASYMCYFIYDVIIKKEKGFIKTILPLSLMLVSFVVILPYAPSSRRTALTNEITENAPEIDADDEIDIEDLPENHVHNMSPTFPFVSSENLEEIYNKIDYLYLNKRINPYFLTNAYLYTEDPGFWYELLQEPNTKLINNRYIEKKILMRVKDLNENKLESYFGMGYSRMQNLFPLEQDFISHYFSIGIVGLIIFLGVYFIPLILIILVLMKGKIFKVKTDFMFALIPLIYVLPLAYFSGNIFDSLFPTIIVSFLISNALLLYRDEELL